MALGQEEIGRRIKQAREDADLTQAELAERIGVRTAQSVSRYERGETEVPTKRLRRIADATGKPFEFFVGESAASQAAAPNGGWDDVAGRLERVEQHEAQNEELLRELLRIVQGWREPPASAAGE